MTVAPAARASSSSGASAASSSAAARSASTEIGAEALEVVVEVRQVRHDEVGAVLAHDLPGGLDDPARRGDRRRGPPVLEERELAEGAGELVVQGGRAHVGVGRLAPVGVVDRPRGDGDVGAGAHRVPPADVRRGEAGSQPSGLLPHLLALHERVVLPPEVHLALVAEVPAVADDAVLGRREAGEHRRLHAARDRGQHGAESSLGAGCREGAEARHVRQGATRHADHVEEEYGGHAGTSERAAAGAGCRVRAGSSTAVTAPSTAVTAPASSAAAAQRTSPAIPATRSSTPPGRTVQV